jgi:hypothetical protein
MFSGIKSDIITKYNSKTKVSLFKFEDVGYTLTYIVSPLVK